MELSNYELVRYPSGQVVLMKGGINAQRASRVGAQATSSASSPDEGEAQSALARLAGRARAKSATRHRPAPHCAVENRRPRLARRRRIGLQSPLVNRGRRRFRVLRPSVPDSGDPMPASAPARHPSIYLLGDHLDAALAMGEDLLTEKVALADAAQQLTMARLVRQNRELAEFLTTVRTLELSLTARLLQARKRAEEMRRRESRLKPLISLFVAGTAPLVDAAMELGDTTTRDFDTGDTAFAFLRSRGLIARDAAGLERLSELRVGEDYLVAGRIRLGTLLDLVATFLDTLDLLYDLYGEPAQPDARPARPQAKDGISAETGRAT